LVGIDKMATGSLSFLVMLVEPNRNAIIAKCLKAINVRLCHSLKLNVACGLDCWIE
jgi:hypothetical protein